MRVCDVLMSCYVIHYFSWDLCIFIAYGVALPTHLTA